MPAAPARPPDVLRRTALVSPVVRSWKPMPRVVMNQSRCCASSARLIARPSRISQEGSSSCLKCRPSYMQMPSRVHNHISPSLSWKMARTELSGRPSSVLKFRNWTDMFCVRPIRVTVRRRANRIAFFIIRSLVTQVSKKSFKIESNPIKKRAASPDRSPKDWIMVDLWLFSVAF